MVKSGRDAPIRKEYVSFYALIFKFVLGIRK